MKSKARIIALVVDGIRYPSRDRRSFHAYRGRERGPEQRAAELVIDCGQPTAREPYGRRVERALAEALSKSRGGSQAVQAVLESWQPGDSYPATCRFIRNRSRIYLRPIGAELPYKLVPTASENRFWCNYDLRAADGNTLIGRLEISNPLDDGRGRCNALIIEQALAMYSKKALRK